MKFYNFTEAVRQMKGHRTAFQGIFEGVQPMGLLYL